MIATTPLRLILAVLWMAALVLTLLYLDELSTEHGLALLVVLGFTGPFAFFEMRRRDRRRGEVEEG